MALFFVNSTAEKSSSSSYSKINPRNDARKTHGTDAVPARNVEVNDADPDASSPSDAATAQVITEDDKGNRKVIEVPIEQKIKGAAQIAGGAAMVAAGIPMCVLPGPGVAFVAGGAALASKGQRNYSGRGTTPLEAKLDETADKLGTAAKDRIERAVSSFARKAPQMAAKATKAIAKKGSQTVGKAARIVAEKGSEVAGSAARAAMEKGPKMADKAVIAVTEECPKAVVKLASATARNLDRTPKRR